MVPWEQPALCGDHPRALALGIVSATSQLVPGDLSQLSIGPRANDKLTNRKMGSVRTGEVLL